jgi:probable selenium-dependent hydroxylase accessory protein YqeC
MTVKLIDALEAESGIVCAIGAGGKKTTLYAIARHHPGRVAITSTVYIPYFPDDIDAAVVVDREAALQTRLEALGTTPRVAYACPGTKSGRHAGVDPALIRRVHDCLRFDLTLVKADGARMRWIKAPKPGEPVLPPGTSIVLVVVSARALGQPLGNRTAQRPDRIAAITGAEIGAPFTPLHMARLLTHEEGLLAGTGNARTIPVVNMVDDEASLGLARKVAETVLDVSPRLDRVVLSRMDHSSDPVVAIIRR